MSSVRLGGATLALAPRAIAPLQFSKPEGAEYGDGYAVVNVERSVDSDGSRKCYCQYGLDTEGDYELKPDNNGRMSCPFERSGALKVPHSYFGPFTGWLKNLE